MAKHEQKKSWQDEQTRRRAFVEQRQKLYLDALQLARKAADEWLLALEASDEEIAEATSMVNETIRDAARAGALDDADLLSGMIARQVEITREEDSAGEPEPK